MRIRANDRKGWQIHPRVCGEQLSLDFDDQYERHDAVAPWLYTPEISYLACFWKSASKPAWSMWVTDWMKFQSSPFASKF